MWQGIRSGIAGLLRWVEHIEAVEWIFKQIGWRDAVFAAIISSGLTGWWRWLSDVPAPLLVAFWLFVALVLIGLIVGFRWIFDKQLPSGNEEGLPVAAPTRSRSSDEPYPDWPIDELFCHIRPDLLERTDDQVGDTWNEVGHQVRDALSIGRLKVWGRTIETGMGQILGEGPAAPRLIDPNYWRSAYFTFAFFDNTAKGERHTYITELKSDLPEFTDLQVNRAEALTVWPTQAPISESLYMTAYEVLHYMTDESKWGSDKRVEETNEGMRKIPLLEAAEEFRNIAKEGKLSALGRLNGKGTHEPIPSAFWFTSTLDLNTIIRRQTSQTAPAVANRRGIPIYTDLQIARADIYKAWPRAAKRRA